MSRRALSVRLRSRQCVAVIVSEKERGRQGCVTRFSAYRATVFVSFRSVLRRGWRRTVARDGWHRRRGVPFISVPSAALAPSVARAHMRSGLAPPTGARSGGRPRPRRGRGCRASALRRSVPALQPCASLAKAVGEHPPLQPMHGLVVMVSPPLPSRGSLDRALLGRVAWCEQQGCHHALLLRRGARRLQRSRPRISLHVGEGATSVRTAWRHVGDA